MFTKILKPIALVLMALALAQLGFQAIGASNRWRYARRAADRTLARSPRTFYIAVNGSDSNSGTSPQQAWRSISKVNQTSFIAGDHVLFQGGAVFTGNLVFDSDDVGTPSHPIEIGSFGSLRAKILAGSGNGIYVLNSGGFEVKNLTIEGAGRGTNHGNGIIFQNDMFGGVKIPFVRVTEVEVAGFGKYGICVAGNHWKSGFRDVRINRVSAHGNALAGIYFYGGFKKSASEHAHRAIYIGYSSAFDNPGISGREFENSGSGIVVSDVDGALVEQNTAFHNGWLSNSNIGGPVGIWAWDSDSVTIQCNRSYKNCSRGPKDGGGFDLDGAVTNSALQYNYSHDNDGAGYLICQFPGGKPASKNIVRYNVSQNDARKNSYGGVEMFGAVEGTEVFNNTVFVNASANGIPVPVRVETGTRDVHFRNNIFYAAKGVPVLRIQAGQVRLLFQGNAYLSSEPNLRFEWQGSEFKSLSEWSAATHQELLASRALGVEFHASAENLKQNWDRFDVYLQPFRSQLIHRGLDLRTLFDLDPGTRDFNGSPLPKGSAYDIGAHQWTDSH